MERFFYIMAVCVLAAGLAVPAAAQTLSASLVGFEDAGKVSGQVTVSSSEVIVSGLQSSYTQALEVYVASAFDLKKGVLVGEIPAGWVGDVKFELSGLDLEDKDTVLLRVHDWLAPVAVGLLKPSP
jgi:hypothetical protein